MSRKVQHIVFLDELQSNNHDAKKTRAFCGEKAQGVTGVGDHIPTCTPCMRVLLDVYNAGMTLR